MINLTGLDIKKGHDYIIIVTTKGDLNIPKSGIVFATYSETLLSKAKVEVGGYSISFKDSLLIEKFKRSIKAISNEELSSMKKVDVPRGTS